MSLEAIRAHQKVIERYMDTLCPSGDMSRLSHRQREQYELMADELKRLKYQEIDAMYFGQKPSGESVSLPTGVRI